MAFLYNLNSCNPSSYPDIVNLCWDTQSHPYNLLVVYIDGANPLDTYTLVYVGQDTSKCVNTIPVLRVATENTCSPSYDIFKYRNCETGVERIFGFPTAPAPGTFKINGECDCWTFLGEESRADEVVTTAFNSYVNCEECLDRREQDLCPTSERTLGYAVKVKLPEQAPVDRGFSKCCYKNLVLADIADADPYKNDFTGSYFKRETPSSTVDFKLVDVVTTTEYALNDATYGTFQDFGGVQDDLSYYIVDWRKVLTLLGEGVYQIKKELTIAGISVDLLSDTYSLESFSIQKANGTVRLDSIIDGKLVAIDTDFLNSGYTTSLRVRGYFGNPEYSYEQDNIAQRDYSFKQNTMSSKKEYKYQALQLPDCITEELFDFMLFGKELFVSDYNGNNHSYKYELTPVKLEGNAGTEYFVTDRGVNVNLTFSDRTEDDRKINC
jgi:hypothetical protein